MHLLLIAYYLSILTFYLGVLIYALPIPVTGLKRWGPRLITDAFFIAILTLSINTIVNVSDYIRILAGGSWEIFFLQIRSTIALRSAIVILLSIFSGILSKFIPGIGKLISLVLNPILASLHSSVLLYTIATVIYRGVWMLSSFGILLMAIPFRVARNAGAFLLSLAIVFYIALPLYHNFYKLLIYSPSTPLEAPIIYGYIVNELGHPIDDGYIGLEASSDSYVGPLPLHNNNYILLTLNSKLLSSPVTLFFDASGHQFYTNVSSASLYNICLQNSTREFYLHLCRVDVMVRGLIAYRNGVALHMLPTISGIGVEVFADELVKIAVNAQHDFELYISIVDAYSIREISIDNSTISIESLRSYRWRWYDLMGSTYIVNVPQGQHTIEIRMELDEDQNTEPSEVYTYLALQRLFLSNDALLTDALNEIARIMYIDIIASILFLSLLISISLGLSRVFGGSSRIRVFP